MKKNQSEETGNYLSNEILVIIFIGLYVGWIFLIGYLVEITGIIDILKPLDWRWRDDYYNSPRLMFMSIKYIGGILVSVFIILRGNKFYVEKMISKNNKRQVEK